MNPMQRTRYITSGNPTTGPGVYFGASYDNGGGPVMGSANVNVSGDVSVRATGFLVLALLTLIILTEMNHR